MIKQATIENIINKIPKEEKNPRLEHFVRRYYKEHEVIVDEKQAVAEVLSAWDCLNSDVIFRNSVSLKWFDEFYENILKIKGKKKGEDLFHKYNHAFSHSYVNRYSPKRAVYDIEKMEESINSNSIALELYDHIEIPAEHFHLKIFKTDRLLPLSEIMPLLENMGLNVIDENPYLITAKDGSQVWIRDYRLEVFGKERPDILKIKANFEDILYKIWYKQLENDYFNSFVVYAGLNANEIMIFKAYAEYLRQINVPYSFSYMAKSIARYPEIAKLIIELFYNKFCPKKKDRDTAKIEKRIEKVLADVHNIDDDTIIRKFCDIIKATLRTNYFKTENPSYISLKIDSSTAPDLPLPRPFVEVFVHSNNVKGIHLRGGEVSRGGLRWSDRSEDFRTEVLGLMKAQMVKNAIIVPIGSKGGFVVKQHPEDRTEFHNLGIECYKIFLNGLLDITDNIVDDKIVPPENVVRYDGDDPYLVVAADKGTATFSDIANGVSAEHNFWLGDAFASGGSAGYDHKKMGITAKGAWISVQRHFMEMGTDIQKTDFTVVGIGDMAGDVFGNGMLLSKHIRLVAAFNHMHIFIDPNPDSTTSFKERKRLFELPRSTWEDYDKKLISKGGGIFSRSEKKIKLSPEIQKMLNTKAEFLAPNALMKSLLKLEADLLWNGGIGTYVKSSDETNEVVGDRANDFLRINGNELNCKVVGEGGNLGLTQLGRIEYAGNGGRINTDAIDNSAGVDCSDHEVNIKIALYDAYKKDKLKRSQRDKLLAKMTKEVAELVLKDNKMQTQAISLMEQNNYKNYEGEIELMNSLEKQGLLDRKIEFLPTDEALIDRCANKKGLTRPEIAVLFSYSKISLYESLFNSQIPDDVYFIQDLIRYFPSEMHEEFKDEIINHKLRKEIVATVITNSLINRLGHTFFNQTISDTGVHPCDVARAYITARDGFNLRNIWADIESLNKKVNSCTQLEMFKEINNFIRHCTKWFLRNCPQPLDISNLMNDYQKGICKVSENLHSIIGPNVKLKLEEKIQYYCDKNIPEDLATRIANLTILTSALSIVLASKKAKYPVEKMGKIYYALGENLDLLWLRGCIRNFEISSHWQRLALSLLEEELYDEQRRLAVNVVKNLCKKDSCDNPVKKWKEQNSNDLERYKHFVDKLKTPEHLTLEMIVVAVTKVQEICSV